MSRARPAPGHFWHVGRRGRDRQVLGADRHRGSVAPPAVLGRAGCRRAHCPPHHGSRAHDVVLGAHGQRVRRRRPPLVLLRPGRSRGERPGAGGQPHHEGPGDGPGGAARCRRPAGAGRPGRALPRLASCRRARGSCSGARRRSGADRPAATARRRRAAGRIASGEARRVTGGGRRTPLPDRGPLRPGPEPRAPPPGGERRRGGDAARRARADLRGPPDRRAPGGHPCHPCRVCPTATTRRRRRPSTTGFRELAAESTRGTLIEVEDTGHNIQDDQPEVVMDAIRDVMAG